MTLENYYPNTTTMNQAEGESKLLPFFLSFFIAVPIEQHSRFTGGVRQFHDSRRDFNSRFHDQENPFSRFHGQKNGNSRFTPLHHFTISRAKKSIFTISRTRKRAFHASRQPMGGPRKNKK